MYNVCVIYYVCSILFPQFPSDCKLYHCETLERLTLYKCETKLRWLENIEPQWPNLTHLSLEKTAMTTDADLKCIAKHNKWAVTIRFVYRDLKIHISRPTYVFFIATLCTSSCACFITDQSFFGAVIASLMLEFKASVTNYATLHC